MKIIFAGSSKFSLSQLNVLFKIKIYNILSIITKPDSKKLTRNKPIINLIKVFALKNNILLLQPDVFKNDIVNKIKNLSPDILIVSSYGLYIPESILDIPKFGCINIHGSLLPQLKGPAPIHWSIINGYKKTGVTFIKMNKKFDDGIIINQKVYKIHKYETYKNLANKLSNLANYMLIEILNNILKFNKLNISSKILFNNASSYARKIVKNDAKIDFNNSAENICRQIRAFNIWPISYFFLKNIKVKIFFAIPKFNSIYFDKIGKIIIKNKKIFITTKKGLIYILKYKLNTKIEIENLNYI